MTSHRFASKVAFFVVLILVGGSFFWWFKNRPSFLLFQAHSQLGTENQSAGIARYQRLLKDKDLNPKEEVRLRLALGDFFIRASGEEGTIVLQRHTPSYDVDHPFLDSARLEYDRVLELDPKNVKAHLGLGRLLLLKGLESFAIEQLGLAIKYDPLYAVPLVELSWIYQDREKPEKARDLAHQALALSPENDRGWWALVNAYIHLGEHDHAQRAYQKISRAYRSSPQVIAPYALYLARQNQWAEAEIAMAEALEKEPENLWVLVRYGEYLILKGLYDDAIGVLTQAGTLYRKSVTPLVYLAKAEAMRGDCHQAFQKGQRLTEGLPRWTWSHLVMAWAYACQGRERLAISECNEALRLSPKFVDPLFFQAQILLDKGKFESFGTLIRPLLDKKEHEAKAYSLMAQSLCHQEQWHLAKEMAEMAIQKNENLARPYVWLGLSRLALGDFEAAERAFQQAGNLNPYDYLALGYYAYYFSQQKREKEADQIMSRAIRNDTRNANLWWIKGQILLYREFFPEAIQSFHQSISLKPYLLKGHLGLVEAYWKDGNRKAAEGAYLSAAKLNAQDKGVSAWREKFRK